MTDQRPSRSDRTGGGRCRGVVTFEGVAGSVFAPRLIKWRFSGYAPSVPAGN
jgi:hypothetical protein